MSCNNITYNVENYTSLQFAEMFIDMWINKIPAPDLSIMQIGELGGFTYPQGLLLRGIQMVYEIDGKPEYNKYITDWIKSTTDDKGIPIHEEHGWISLDSLDFRQPGNLFFDLYNQTKDIKYLMFLAFA